MRRLSGLQYLARPGPLCDPARALSLASVAAVHGAARSAVDQQSVRRAAIAYGWLDARSSTPRGVKPSTVSSCALCSMGEREHVLAAYHVVARLRNKAREHCVSG